MNDCIVFDQLSLSSCCLAFCEPEPVIDSICCKISSSLIIGLMFYYSTNITKIIQNPKYFADKTGFIPIHIICHVYSGHDYHNPSIL